jgi:hypothetical protein
MSGGTGHERGGIATRAERHQSGLWIARTHLEKREGDYELEGISRAAFMRRAPYEVLEHEGNLLVTAGINLLLDLLIGAGGTVYSNANAFIGVGDGNGSVPTAAQADTDLTAPTNRLKKGMNATYPQRGTRQCSWQSDFVSAEANFAWREWGIYNGGAAFATGTMLNHKGEDNGTKVSGATWTFTVTASIS